MNCAKEEAVAHFFWYIHTSSCQLLCQPGHLTEHASAQQVEEMENDSEATNKTHDFGFLRPMICLTPATHPTQICWVPLQIGVRRTGSKELTIRMEPLGGQEPTPNASATSGIPPTQ